LICLAVKGSLLDAYSHLIVLAFRIGRPIQREPIAHQSLRNVYAIKRTHRNRAPVLVQADRRAVDRPSSYEGAKFVRCLGPAAILQTILAPTKLTAFGCVNAPKANARPVNFERVTINNAGLTGQIVRQHWRGANTYHEDQSSRREASERQFERPNPFSANVLMLCKRICIA
jgi:hypothetical protein